MKTSLMLSAAALTLLLAGCGNPVRQAADNTPVNVIPLAGAEVSGTLSDTTAASLKPQDMTSQSVSSGTLTFSGTFDDFDPSTIPSIVGSPSGLDVPIQVSAMAFSCAFIPTSPNITVTLKNVSLSVSDSVHGSKTASTPLNAAIPMKLTSPGKYTVDANLGSSVSSMLSLVWSQFSDIVNKSGTNTPNSFTLAIDVSVDSDTSTALCKVNMKLADSLKQYARFQ